MNRNLFRKSPPFPSRFKFPSPAQILSAGILLAISLELHAADVIRDGTFNKTLDDGRSWSGGLSPDLTDTAVWKSGSALSGNSFNVGGAWGGLWIQSTVGGDVSISSGSLTLGGSGGSNISSGIRLDSSSYDLTIGSALTVGANQTWDVTAAGGLITTGAVNLGSNNTVTTSGAGAVTINGAISGTGELIQTGTGTLTLAGANTYTGALTGNSGTVKLSGTGSLSASTTLQLGGGTFNLVGSGSGTRSQTVNGLTVNEGQSSVELTTAGFTTTLNLGALNRSSGTGSIDFRATSNNLGTTALVKTTTGLTNGIFGAWATVNNGTDLATKDGSGNIVAYSLYTDIPALGGSITSSSASNVRINSTGSGGNIVLTAAAGTTTSINTLVQNTATAATVDLASKTLRLTSGGILVGSGKAGLTIGTSANSGVLTVGSGTGGELLLNNNSANTLTIHSAITNDGAGVVGLTKLGTGSLTLSGTNTYSGVTSIQRGTVTLTGSLTATSGVKINNGGTLLLGKSNAINNGASLTLSGGTFKTGGFSEGDATTIGLGTLILAASSIIDLSGAADVLHLANSAAASWTAGTTLSIYNYTVGADRFLFGSNSSALSSIQLGQIEFFSGNGTGSLGFGAFTGSNGEVIPTSAIPEPTTVLGAFLMLGLIGYRERRRWLCA